MHSERLRFHTLYPPNLTSHADIVNQCFCLSFFFLGYPLNRLNSTAGQYAEACVQVAGQCGAAALDLWTLMQKDGQVGDRHARCRVVVGGRFRSLNQPKN